VYNAVFAPDGKHYAYAMEVIEWLLPDMLRVATRGTVLRASVVRHLRNDIQVRASHPSKRQSGLFAGLNL
jgi:hypothetical protein